MFIRSENKKFIKRFESKADKNHSNILGQEYLGQGLIDYRKAISLLIDNILLLMANREERLILKQKSNNLELHSLIVTAFSQRIKLCPRQESGIM